MEIKESKYNEKCTIVSLTGSLDLNGVQEIEMDFARITSANNNIIVDLSGLEFIASLGMRMLLSSAKKLNAGGLKMVVINPEPVVKEALDTVGLFSVIPLAESETEAADMF